MLGYLFDRLRLAGGPPGDVDVRPMWEEPAVYEHEVSHAHARTHARTRAQSHHTRARAQAP